MKPSERKDALRILHTDWLFTNAEHRIKAWDTVRKWIRNMVRIEPTVMREVSKREFGDLGSWLEKGKGNVQACGCLVGTTALVLVERRNHFKPDAKQGEFIHTTNEFENENTGYDIKGDRAQAVDVVTKLAQEKFSSTSSMQWAAEEAGCKAGALGTYLGQETAVALIKDEITRQLVLRSKRLKNKRK